MQLFNEIHLRNLRGDLFGGVTAAIIALPMALAFGVASGAGAEAGLYGAILVGLFAALFGGSPTLISEPTGPMTVVFAAVITKLVAADPEHGLAMAFTVVVLAGVFQILFGLMRLGRYVTLMPYTVVSGFMSGIGFILIILQLAPVLGHPTQGGVMPTLQALPELVRDLRPAETALAVLTLAVLLLMPRRSRRYVPPQLVALVAGTAVSLLLLSDEGIRRIGEIPTGLPSLQLPRFSVEQWQSMLVDAAVLGMLGCIDALLTSVIADSLTRSRHDSDKELLGQGVGNVVSGLFGGLPGAGATMGTVVNIQAGARTALSGLTRAAILLVVVLGAADLTEVIPLAVLAGIAVHVGLNIVDWRFLRRAHRISGKGSLITYGVILLTVFEDLIVAVGLGLFVANIITIRRLSEVQAENVKAVTDPDDPAVDFTEEERALMRRGGGCILLFHLSGPLVFGATRAISRTNSAVADTRVLVVDLHEVQHLGVSVSLALESAVDDMLAAGRPVFIVGAAGQTRERLDKLGLLERLPAQGVQQDRPAALRLALASLEQGPRATPEAEREPAA